MDFKTLEDVGTFMLINIRLSRYDLQFVNNLTNMIGVKNTITTNQDSLFKKIALKYRRQYVQQKFDIDTLLLLPWKCNVIESSPQYTNASISIIKDDFVDLIYLILKFFICPFFTFVKHDLYEAHAN